MAGLPHYTNSVAGLRNYDPVYLNQFEILITPPFGALPPVQSGENILTQNVKSITGLAVDIQPTAPVSQFYKFSERRYSGGEPSTSDMDLTVEFEVNLDSNNSMLVYNTLRRWADLIYNPLTGGMGLKRDYVGSMVISVFNKRGDVYRRIRIPSCFLSAPINEMTLDYNEGNAIYIMSVSWKCDYWDDQFI
jgi:hypothetical protein